MSDTSKNEQEPKEARHLGGIVKGVVEPFYKDVIRPSAPELSKTVDTLARAVNAALMPVRGILYGAEKFENVFLPRVARRLAERGVPKDRIRVPSTRLAVPMIQGLMLTQDEPTLHEMFAQLLAAALDEETGDAIHPSFAEVIGSLTSQEAALLTWIGWVPHAGLLVAPGLGESSPWYFLAVRGKQAVVPPAGMPSIQVSSWCTDKEVVLLHPSRLRLSLSNLERLGLVELSPFSREFDDLGQLLEQMPAIEEHLRCSKCASSNEPVHVDRSPKFNDIHLSRWGYEFLRACAEGPAPAPEGLCEGCLERLRCESSLPNESDD